jgi:MoaA/NifB/PqqE/SkfB family radical SAM enzyme
MLITRIRKDHKLALERLPCSVAITLTKRCNLSCKICDVKELQKKDPSSEKIMSLLDEAYKLGARRFDPCGAELFMRDDMPNLLAYADRIGFREIYVVSNGLLLNRTDLLDKLALIKSLVLIVSIDGPKEIHDELRGTGVFDQAVSSLSELGRRGIRRSIASIIMRPTINHLHKMIDLAADLNIRVISMQPYSRDVAGHDCNHSMFEFKPDEKKMVAKKLKDLLKYARKKKVIIYTENMMQHIASYLSDGITSFPPHGCHVPSKTLVVDIEGNAHPCFVIEKNMGNVNEMSLSSIWHSDIHKEFIISALERKCPRCMNACSDVEGYNTRTKKISRYFMYLTPDKLALYIKKRLHP